MNRGAFLRSILFAAAAPSVLITACSEKKTGEADDAAIHTFTCPMHPQIVQDKPGTCPICGMDLVLFDKNSADSGLTLSKNQKALANITTAAIGATGFENQVYLNGRLAVNPEQTTFISSRVAGRIETLYVKETGIYVRKGQPLYKIYAEQLLTLQEEYLLAMAQARRFQNDQRFQDILQAARQKLVLYGQSNDQLQQLANTGKTDPFITYYTLQSGNVADILVNEGQYVAEGATLLKLEGYDTLWVEADVYPSEARQLKVGQKLKVLIAGWENEPQEMTVQFILPSLSSGAQVLQVRGSIRNPDNRWRPGMRANIVLSERSPSDGLSVPVNAIINDGKTQHVWLALGGNRFEPRKVTTGSASSDRVEILSGLKQGDQLVVTGAYLLYSEYILKKGKHPLGETL